MHFMGLFKVFFSSNLHFHSFELLKAKYPCQSQTFWKNIQTEYVHSIVNKRDPSIIIIASDLKTFNVSEKICYDIVKYFYNPLDRDIFKYSNFVIDPEKGELEYYIKKGQVDRVKMHIDQKMKEIVNNGNKVIFIKDLEKFPSNIILLLHLYGDTWPNSQFQDILIIVTLKLDRGLTNLERNDMIDDLKSTRFYVENYLQNLWIYENLNERIQPFFSRVSSMLLVNEEKNLLI